MEKINKRSRNYKAGILAGAQQQAAIDARADAANRQAKEQADLRVRDIEQNVANIRAKMGGAQAMSRYLTHLFASAGID